MKKAFKAKDYMSRTIVRFMADMEIQEAMNVLLDRRVPGGPVFDKLGNIVGVLTEKDCLQAALQASYHEGFGGRVSEFMSENVVTVDWDDDILGVAKEFSKLPYRYFPVLKESRFVGHISRREVLKALANLRDDKFQK